MSAIDASAIEGLVITACAVGTFGELIRRNLKKARQEQIDAAIEKARLQDENRRLRGDDSG